MPIGVSKALRRPTVKKLFNQVESSISQTHSAEKCLPLQPPNLHIRALLGMDRPSGRSLQAYVPNPLKAANTLQSFGTKVNCAYRWLDGSGPRSQHALGEGKRIVKTSRTKPHRNSPSRGRRGPGGLNGGKFSIALGPRCTEAKLQVVKVRGSASFCPSPGWGPALLQS